MYSLAKVDTEKPKSKPKEHVVKSEETKKHRVSEVKPIETFAVNSKRQLDSRASNGSHKSAEDKSWKCLETFYIFLDTKIILSFQVRNRIFYILSSRRFIESGNLVAVT